MVQPRRKGCFELFCGVETASQHPAVCVRSSPAVTCRGIGADEARLRQRHIGRTEHGATLPHLPALPGEQRWLLAASMLVIIGQARCSSYRTHDHRWLCVQTAARVWNSLPMTVQSFESLDIFRRRLKTELFEHSYN